MSPVSTEPRSAPPRPASSFATGHLLGDLKGRAVRGGAVTLLAQGGKLAVNLAATFVLARLLEPGDFGAIAMVTAFTGFLALFKDMGLTMATVQKRELTAREVNTLFWVNVAVSVVLAEVCALIAPAVALFYGQAHLVGITVALGGAIFLGGLAAQHQALLRRQMRFGRLAVIDVGSLLFGAAVGVGFGLAGAGVWSLVAMQLSVALFTCLGSWWLWPWRPGRPGTLRDVKALLGFGANLTGFSILSFGARNVDKMLIGRVFGASAVGLYSKAYGLMMLPVNAVNAPLGTVAVPALSPIANDAPRYREAFLRLLEKLALLTLPGVAMLVATSDWVVRIILGPKWDAAAQIFSILGVAALTQPLSSATGWLFISQGRTGEQLRWAVIGVSLIIASFFAGLPWGPVGVAACYAFSGPLLRLPLLFWFAGRRGPVSVGDLYRAPIPAACAAAATLGALFLLRHLWTAPNAWAGLGVALALGLAVTVGTLLCLPAGRRLLGDLKGALPALKRW